MNDWISYAATGSNFCDWTTVANTSIPMYQYQYHYQQASASPAPAEAKGPESAVEWLDRRVEEVCVRL